MTTKQNSTGEATQHVGYRYDVNLLPDYSRLTPFLKKYIELMGWDDLNWLEDVHLGYEEGRAAVFDRNLNGWVTVPDTIVLPKNQQDRDMIAREFLIKFQMSQRNPAGDAQRCLREAANNVAALKKVGGAHQSATEAAKMNCICRE